jgi:hypothetical protein
MKIALSEQRMTELLMWADVESPTVRKLIEEVYAEGWRNGAHHVIMNEWDEDDLDQFMNGPEGE